MPVTDDSAWVALSLLQHVGGKTLRALVAHFGSADRVLQADRPALQAVRGVGEKIAAAIQQIDLDRTRREMDVWRAQQITIAPRYTRLYPDILRTLDDEPPTVFYRGALALAQIERAVAIVGTRQPSPDARKIAFRLAALLAQAGYVVVSGLAMGIDTAAHYGALSVRSGQTVAVLGSGVLNVYPLQNHTLGARILKRGALLSENHPDATPNAPRLVSRNRIISGLCQHAVIVESAIDGGAMYTATACIDQGRTLHAVDLPAAGNQMLLQQGAHVISSDLQKRSL